MSRENPLISPTPSDALPAFDRIRPEHAEPAVDAVLAENRTRLAAVLADAGAPSANVHGEDLVEPMAEMQDRLARAWGPVSHLFGVVSTTEWRAAYSACLPKVTAFDLELSQSEPLHRAYQRLGASGAFAALPAARQKVVSDALRDFKLAGVSLPESEKARFKETALRLSELQAKFEENLLDSVQSFGKHVTGEARASGSQPPRSGAGSHRAVAVARVLRDRHRVRVDGLAAWRDLVRRAVGVVGVDVPVGHGAPAARLGRERRGHPRQ